METTTLQIPLPKSLKSSATALAKNYGFSSLQEIVRVFLSKLSAGEIDISFTPKVKLSPKAIRRYNKLIDDVESGKVKSRAFTNINKMMEYLGSDE